MKRRDFITLLGGRGVAACGTCAAGGQAADHRVLGRRHAGGGRRTVCRVRGPAPAFEAFKDQVNGLYVVSDSLIAANLTRITGSALSARLPTIFNHSRFRQSRRFHILWKSDIHNRRV
jgi:hypothetical protein